MESPRNPAYIVGCRLTFMGSSHSRIQIAEKDLHTHLKARMAQRGVTREEIEQTLNEGWEAVDAHPSTQGKVTVLAYQRQWEGQFYEEKEVAVYYKVVRGSLVLLTVKARYGKNFPRGQR